MTPIGHQRDTEFKMLRVLMVLDDYGELMFLQTVLKKMGFDVDAIQNPRLFQDSVLRMNPDVLVMTALGKRVKGLELLNFVRKVRGVPRVLMLHAAGLEPGRVPGVDDWLDSPVAATKLLSSIALLCNLDNEALQEKFKRMRLQESFQEEERQLKPENEPDTVLEKSRFSGPRMGNLEPSSLTPTDRQERYKKFLQEKPPEQHGFALKRVQDQIKVLRKSENIQETEDLEKQRKAFVEHLFKKG